MRTDEGACLEFTPRAEHAMVTHNHYKNWSAVVNSTGTKNKFHPISKKVI